MPDYIEYFLFLGFAGLMFLLRLDTRRFGAAEWDTQRGDWRAWAPDSRGTSVGSALALLIFALHPSPVSDLNLSFVPDRGGAIFVGLFYGICGSMFAFGIAWVRGGRLRFPSTDRYPGGVLSSIGTAFYDEFLFRGVILGLLLGLGLPDWVAVGGGRDRLRGCGARLDDRSWRPRHRGRARHRPRERSRGAPDRRHRGGDRGRRDHPLRAVPRARTCASRDAPGHAVGSGAVRHPATRRSAGRRRG